MILLLLFCAVSAIHWDAPWPYDPVWLASVEQFGPVPSLNETRFWFWGWSWSWFKEEDVQFKLFTRRNPYEFQVLKTNDSLSLRDSNFDFNNKVKVLAHGWLNNADGPMPESIKEAYLNISDLNIIVVDWGNAANVNYVLASYNVAMVGRLLTDFLNFLIVEGVSMDNVHLIGHSLGAHIVGIAGDHVKYGPVDTITGLDPAKPLFSLSNKDARLDKHDARHVEVIHTCGDYLGFSDPLGHIDFYPNGGTRQPGCGYDYRGLCAHNRAHMFFAESIISEVPFTAVRCREYDELYYNASCEGTGETLIMGGFDIHYGKDGIYYLKTNAEKPYALGEPT
ncbi:pancreatic lipase-related protein 2-like [Cydia strobilella]|uniref:pancreatic lipase-related protein 2-like n=1 Tax=Cydia strobilella TaxID=1100964 RepID=UPI003004FE2B